MASLEMKPLSQSVVTVVGLGLMGGSLAGALRGHCAQVIGVDSSPETLEAALRRGFVDRGVLDLKEGVAEADITILATPVRTIIRLLGEIGPWLREGSLLLDLGSTKEKVLEAMTAYPITYSPWVGTRCVARRPQVSKLRIRRSFRAARSSCLRFLGRRRQR